MTKQRQNHQHKTKTPTKQETLNTEKDQREQKNFHMNIQILNKSHNFHISQCKMLQKPQQVSYLSLTTVLKGMR